MKSLCWIDMTKRRLRMCENARTCLEETCSELGPPPECYRCSSSTVDITTRLCSFEKLWKRSYAFLNLQQIIERNCDSSKKRISGSNSRTRTAFCSKQMLPFYRAQFDLVQIIINWNNLNKLLYRYNNNWTTIFLFIRRRMIILLRIPFANPMMAIVVQWSFLITK